MPHVSVVLPDVQQSVSRPIIFDIVNQVQSVTKITKTARIMFAGDRQRTQQPGTTIDDTSHDALLPSNRFVFIEVDEDYDKETLGSTAVHRKEHIPVFLDESIGISIVPVYTTTNVVINFKYRTPSKSEAMAWREDVRIRVSQMRDINLHKFTYHYLLPVPYLTLLQDIHYCRENVAGYGDSFTEYVTKYASNRLTLIGDLVNKSARLAISETQTRILGQYEFEGVPDKPEFDEALGVWTVGFSYRFSYEKPSGCAMEYPIMVHNQLLPKEYVIFDSSDIDFEKASLMYSNTGGALNYFEAPLQLEHYLVPNSIVRLPLHDEFELGMEPPGTATVMTALCEVDLTRPDLLVNLKELDPFVIDADILEFIQKSEYPYVGKLYKSIIQLQMYRNKNFMSNPGLVCTSGLDVSAPVDLNPRFNYRLRFGLVTDLTFLDKAAVDRLCLYPKALVKIVQAINEVFRDNPGIDTLGQRRYVGPQDFSAIYRQMTGLNYNGTGRMANQVTTPATGSRLIPSMEVAYQNHRLDSLRDVRGMTLENYRQNHIQTNTLMTSYIVASRHANQP